MLAGSAATSNQHPSHTAHRQHNEPSQKERRFELACSFGQIPPIHFQSRMLTTPPFVPSVAERLFSVPCSPPCACDLGHFVHTPLRQEQS